MKWRIANNKNFVLSFGSPLFVHANLETLGRHAQRQAVGICNGALCHDASKAFGDQVNLPDIFKFSILVLMMLMTATAAVQRNQMKA